MNRVLSALLISVLAVGATAVAGAGLCGAITDARAQANVESSGEENPVGPSEQEIERRVMDAVRQHHPTEGPDWWRGLGPKAPAVIIRLYRQTRNTHHQQRLLQALGWFNDPIAAEFVREITRSTNSSLMREAGLRTIVIAEGESAAAFVSEFLGHREPATRFAAAQALRSIGTAEAQAQYEEYLQSESVDWVRRRLEAAPPPAPLVGLNGRTRSAQAPELIRPGESSAAALREGGKWAGVWLVPSSGGEGVQAVQAKVRVSKDGTGALELEGGDRFRIRGMSVQAASGYGFVQRVDSGGGEAGGSDAHSSGNAQRPFVAQLLPVSTGSSGEREPIMQLEVKSLGALFLGRAAPAE